MPIEAPAKAPAARRHRTTRARSKSATVQLRLSDEEMRLLDAGADQLGTSRSALLRDSALRAAREALARETTLLWSDEAFGALTAALEGPRQPNAALQGDLARRPLWERG